MSEVPPMTFWDHLDELRSVLIRILVVTVLIATFAFCLKDELFAVVLAPRTSDFITYRLMGVEPFSIHLMIIYYMYSSDLCHQRSMTMRKDTPHCLWALAM